MKKLCFVFIVVIILVAITAYATAEPFSIRNGIQWGDSEDTFKEKINSESGSENYKIWTINKMDWIKFPDGALRAKVWNFRVEGSTLGRSDELVYLLALGTKKYGLHMIGYYVYPENFENAYDRAKELVSQLEQKYAPFKVKKDNWKNHKKAKDGTIIFEAGTDKAEDCSWISVCIIKVNDGDYHGVITIEYHSPEYDLIDKALQDGSFFKDQTEPAFGL